MSKKEVATKPEIKKGKLVHPDLMTPEQISALLPEIDEIVRWANAVKAFALDQALKGTKYAGFKVVEGRSNRTFTNVEAVADRLVGEGYDEDLLYERKFKTLTQLEALVGKKNFETVLGDLVEKPQGKPTLVPDTDKRPEFNPEAAAAADFED